VTSVSLGPSKHEIVEYLHVGLGGGETPDVKDKSLEEDILEKILETMSEMYAWTVRSGILPQTIR